MFKSKRNSNCWVAPEHARFTLGMKRDYPRNDLGEPISTQRELVVDPRPTIMVEEKKRYEPYKKVRDRRPKVVKAPKNNGRKKGFCFSEGRWSFDPTEEESQESSR